MESLTKFFTRYKVITCFIFTIFIDLCFYKGRFDWLLGVSGLLLVGLITLCNSSIVRNNFGRVILGFSIVSCLALFEDVSFESVSLALVFIGTLSLIRNKKFHFKLFNILLGVLANYFLMIFYVASDLISIIKNRFEVNQVFRKLALLVLPIIFSLIFILTFAVINPLIRSFFGWIDIKELLSPIRFLFWILSFSLVWGLIRNRFNFNISCKQIKFKDNNVFLNYSSVVTSLWIFNFIFLTQVLSEVYFSFLDTSTAIMHSVVYQSQTAAYTLLGTAILSIFIILIADQVRSNGIQNNLLKRLLSFWILENIMLLIFAVRKLCTYIESYSLTYMRVYAMIWIALVGIGFILIAIKVQKNLKFRWLLNANALSLFLTLSLCSFINFPNFIASYNLTHSREITGRGKRVDFYYISNLGYEALPAMINFRNNFLDSSQSRSKEFLYFSDVTLKHRISCFRRNYNRSLRGWSFRKYRINRFIEKYYQGN